MTKHEDYGLTYPDLSELDIPDDKRAQMGHERCAGCPARIGLPGGGCRDGGRHGPAAAGCGIRGSGA